jgi:dTMP kinase
MARSGRGRLIAVCGIDGAGKSSLVAQVAARLGPPVLAVRKDVRDAVERFERHAPPDAGDPDRWSGGPFAQCVAAASALDFLRHYERVIAPALAAGHLVLADRYAPCYRAYLRATRTPLDDAAPFAGLPVPDLSVLVDVPVEVAVARHWARGGPSPDETPAVLTAVRGAYHALVAEEPGRWRILDNTKGFDEACALLQSWIEPFLDGGEDRP